MSKIWIPGSSGMLGEAFVNELSKTEHEIIKTDSKLDISDTFMVIEFVKHKKPDIIINCAAYTDVDGAEMEVEKSWRVNANGPMNIAIAASYVGATPIHFSTDYVFNGNRTSSIGYIEKDSTNSINHYGFTKLAGEKKFHALTSNGFVIRTSWLFSYIGSNFVRTILSLMKHKEKLDIVCDQIGKPTYAPDLAKYVLDLIKKDFDDKIIHIANSGSISWFDFAGDIYRIGKELGLLNNEVSIYPVSTEYYSTKSTALRPKRSVLNTDRVEELLGYPLNSWRDSLRDCLTSIKYFEETGQDVI